MELEYPWKIYLLKLASVRAKFGVLPYLPNRSHIDLWQGFHYLGYSEVSTLTAWILDSDLHKRLGAGSSVPNTKVDSVAQS